LCISGFTRLRRFYRSEIAGYVIVHSRYYLVVANDQTRALKLLCSPLFPAGLAVAFRIRSFAPKVSCPHIKHPGVDTVRNLLAYTFFYSEHIQKQLQIYAVIYILEPELLAAGFIVYYPYVFFPVRSRIAVHSV